MDMFLIEKIAVKRLMQRCIGRDGASLLFRLDRATGVAVSCTEWEAIGRDYRAAVAPSARWLRRTIWLQIPVAIMLLVAVSRVAVLGRAWDAIDRVAPGVPLLAVTIVLPVIAFLRHVRIVGGTLGAIVAALAQRPHFDLAGQPTQRRLHLLEVIVLIVFGPGAFIESWGSVSPHAYDHTPWMGRHLQWDGVVGLIALTAIIAAQLWSRRAPMPVAQSPARLSFPTPPPSA